VDCGAARGGDWLEDEIARWSGQGASAVLSLLTTDEERDLGLENEPAVARELGMEFVSLPVPDRGIAPSERDFAHAIEWSDWALSAGGRWSSIAGKESDAAEWRRRASSS
jgi:hypothetical protein